MTISYQLYKGILGFFVFIAGLVFFLQASDLNPLLLIKDYGLWVNTHFPLGTKFFWLWLIPCLIVGGGIMSLGLILMKKPLPKGN